MVVTVVVMTMVLLLVVVEVHCPCDVRWSRMSFLMINASSDNQVFATRKKKNIVTEPTFFSQ